jgi:hypothetical protein
MSNTSEFALQKMARERFSGEKNERRRSVRKEVSKRKKERDVGVCVCVCVCL